MYKSSPPPELERKPSYNTLEIGGRSAKFLARSGSLGSRHRLLPSAHYSPSSNPFSENKMLTPNIMLSPNKRALLARTESGSLRVSTLVSLMHVAITLALAVTCTVLYRDRLMKNDFIDACEMDHVTTRHELELTQTELNRYKILQNTFSAPPVAPVKCPECPPARESLPMALGGRRKQASLSTVPVDSHSTAAMKRLIEERDELERRLKTAHLKAAPVFLRTIEKYRASERRLIGAIQDMSRELLAARFGPGPYYAEMVLGFPGADVDPQNVMLEINGRDTPYTALYFLTQLDFGLWRGCHFNFNPGHILQADPDAAPARPGRYSSMAPPCDRGRFNRVPYADQEGKVLFQEYAENKPHVPFTLGLPGRSGGPSFYINTLDNTQPHGPGGQPSDDEQMFDPSLIISGSSSGAEGRAAEPCFGRVVSGYDVLQKMQQQPVVAGEGSKGKLSSFVTVLDAVIVQRTHPASNKRFIDDVLNNSGEHKGL